jgi:hypothetical protein
MPPALPLNFLIAFGSLYAPAARKPARAPKAKKAAARRKR